MAAATASATTKAAISAASTAVSAVGSIVQGISDSRAADFEAQQLQAQAQRDREIALQEGEEFADAEARRRARLRALSGGASEGTPLAVLSDLAGEAEFQRLRILAGGEAQATRAENQAAFRRFEGRSARSAGFTRAGATLLTGATKFERGPNGRFRLRRTA